MTKCYRLFIGAFVLFFLSACQHYHLGSPDSDTENVMLWIEPIQVEDAVSGAVIHLNRELREAVIRGRGYLLSSDREHADQVLQVVLKKSKRDSLVRQIDDTGLSDVLRVELLAHYRLQDSQGHLLKEGEVSADGQIFRESGFNESFRQRSPSLLQELAQDILYAINMIW